MKTLEKQKNKEQKDSENSKKMQTLGEELLGFQYSINFQMEMLQN